MSVSNRPLSPHLQVYRLPLAGLISISHRLTGIALSLGTFLFTYWLTAAAYGPNAFHLAQSIIGSWFGWLVLFAFTFALYFHLANGIRHLFWDIGIGFEIPTVRRSGIAVIFVSSTLTLVTWAYIWNRVGN